MKATIRQVSAIIFLSFIQICKANPDKTTMSFLSLRTEISDLNLTRKQSSYNRSITKYFNYYDFPIHECKHYYGMFYTGNDTCFSQVFIPEKINGTYFIVHGYLDHSGFNVKLLKYLLSQNYAVGLFDLPGHGLSSGDRANISDFRDYAEAIDVFVNQTTQYLPCPYGIIGHSTGAAATVEYVYTYKNDDIDRIILCAPLVRGVLPHLSRIGYILFSPFLKKTVRLNRRSSHDKQFLKWKRDDPLYITRFPLQWAHAHMIWQKRMRQYPVNTVACFIIQGDNDRVVDWRYNIKVLKGKFPSSSVYFIKKAKHHLMNETPEYLNSFLSTIQGIIQKKK